MDRPNDSQQPPSRPRKPASSTQTTYLILYNLLSATLWAIVLARTLHTSLALSPTHVFPALGTYTKWTQTLAGLEILHAATGVVRAPLFTTLMQVASRFLLVWGVAEFFPDVAAREPAYASMLVAWSVTEVVRYGYFAVNLVAGAVPAPLRWLRYNTFFVLYPVGIASECWLVWKAVEPARSWGVGLDWVFIAILVVYVPGAYILFTHMMAQRRKVMRGDAKSGKKQK